MKEYVNQTEFGNRVGITKGRVSQLIKDGIIEKEPNGKLDFEKCKELWQKRTVQQAVKKPKRTKKAEKVPPAMGNDNERYVAARAKATELKVERERLLLKELAGDLVRKSTMLAALKKAVSENNASIKTKIVSIPRRLALAWPDPKQKAIVESVTTEIVNECLKDLTNIDLEKLNVK